MKLSKQNEQNSGKKPLRIFVDANTIISGLLFDGNEATLLRLGETGLCTLVTTQYVIDEVTRVLLAEEFRLSGEEIVTFLSYTNKCIRVNTSLKPSQLLKYYSRLADKKDVHVLAGFSELDCDILVTGDKELLRKVTKARTTRQTLEVLLG
jgi:putative PIN family toxin of toxin-antitoxin system